MSREIFRMKVARRMVRDLGREGARDKIAHLLLASANNPKQKDFWTQVKQKLQLLMGGER